MNLLTTSLNDSIASDMDCKDIKKGDLVLYKGGLFRVAALWSVANLGQDWYAQVGDEVVHIDDIQKADWRDVAKITKGGSK